MSNVLKMLKGGGAAAATDEHFENTVLLLHGDGNQGATNFSNTGSPSYLAFKDNSTNNFPITVNGDAYGDNFGPYAVADGNWSNFFDGSGDKLNTASNAAFGFGTGNFTVELWIYPVSVASKSVYHGSVTDSFIINVDASNKVVVRQYGVADLFTTTNALTLNAWNHVAVSRSSTTLSVWINGTREATGSNSTNWATTAVYIGGADTSAAEMTGYLSNVRAVKGTAVYDPSSTTITVPTAPLTAISNTQLLTCQSNRFVDNSTNNFAITRNGDVRVQVFNPFGVRPDGVNGSGYFDGTGDFLALPSNSAFGFGSGDFTMECWFYKTTSNLDVLIDTRIGAGGNANGMALYVQSNTLKAGNDAERLSGGTIYNNSWNHCAVVRSGNNLYLYLNGTRTASAAFSTAQASASSPYIANSGSNEFAGGHISNVRLLKGTAQYTGTTYTVPTSPLTAVTNTSLLTCQYAGSVRNVGFIDSGPYDFPITRVGNTTQGTFSPFSKPDGAWGNFFDGTGDYLTTTWSVIGSNQFTCEAWVYITEGSARKQIVGPGTDTATHYDGFGFEVQGQTLNMWASSNGSSWNLVTSDTSQGRSANSVPLNAWTHIAMTRDSSGVFRSFINGKLECVVSPGTAALADSGTTILNIGRSSYLGNFANYLGYMSNFRIVNGSVVSDYSTASTTVGTQIFTPSTAPLTAISGTSLLTCQSNRFIDNSSNAFAITRNGDVKVTPFSPFPITTAYDPAVNGGSGYFDGSGDYLSVPASAQFLPGANTDFTFEAWVYLTATPGAQSAQIVGTGEYGLNADWSISVNSSRQPNFYINVPPGGLAVTSSTAINLFSWNHIAVTRSGTGSNNLKMFLNGVNVGQTSTNITLDYSGNNLSLGADENGDEAVLTGYISGLRLINGTGYTSITTPTSPPTAIANTVLLTNFTNAGIFDNTGFNNLETVGNAQIDTTTKKYGTGSMEFDGTGDWLVMPRGPDLYFGSGNFTVECWVYPIASPNQPIIVGQWSGSTGGTTLSWAIMLSNDANRNLRFLLSSNGSSVLTDTVSSSALSLNTWSHVALVRNGSVFTAYLNGIAATGGTYTITAGTALYDATNQISVGANSAGTQPFNGYIDDLRITKGIARYTSNFTPPTTAFEDIGV